MKRLFAATGLLVAAALYAAFAGTQPRETIPGAEALRAAISDLATTYPHSYTRAGEFLARLEELERAPNGPAAAKEFEALRREALVANPLVSDRPILFVVREQYRPDHHNTETMFQTGEINTASFVGGGALKVIDFGKGGEVGTILESLKGIIRDPSVDFDGKRILFSMRKNGEDDYHIYEIHADGSGLRQLTSGGGVTDIDPMFLPSGDIVFSSSREPKYCHCNRHIMCNLFRMNANGGDVVQIGHNTLFEGHPSAMPDGRVMYDRWEYVDRHFGPSFGLWTVNPDGTEHELYYGNNDWAPGAMLFPRAIPGTDKVVCVFGSCHDRPWGAIAVVDKRFGMGGSAPVEHIWPAQARELLNTTHDLGNGSEWGHPIAGQIDNFTRVTPKYEDPYPLSDKYFLCSRAIEGERMGIFLIDVFGNEVLLHAEGPGCFSPMPLAAGPRPPVIPSRVDYSQHEGRFYVGDVYTGTGMDRVPRGTIKYLRVIEAPQKLFWSAQGGGIDATQAPVMNWNCTNSKRILGDVPVEADGSAYFSVPSDKFIFFQALDKDKMMVQSMRSGTSIMPGETQGCVGCHEDRRSAAVSRRSLALSRAPSRIEPWYGPTRDFNYLTEVQPVWDRHCVSCHDFGKPAGKRLVLAGDLGPAFNMSYVELCRKSPLRFFPDGPGAPKVLIKAVHDGPPEVLPPYAWGSHRSRLIDLLLAGHHGVRLDKESFARVATWIDLNAPYYGYYYTAFGDNQYGRSPLTPAQCDRLTALTGVAFPADFSVERNGQMLDFTRPELSPILSQFRDKSDAKYKETLAILRAGKEALAKYTRADMPDARLPDVERPRWDKYNALARAQRETRKAIAARSTER